MNTLIVYASKYGCTEKCVGSMAYKLNGMVETCNLKVERDTDLSEFDQVIIGGSIYMGRIQKEVREFCAEHVQELKTKRLGLFICCMREGVEAEEELRQAFPDELLDVAIVKDYFGGEFKFDQMKAVDRFIAKHVAKVDHDQSTVSLVKIQRFVKKMNNIEVVHQ